MLSLSNRPSSPAEYFSSGIQRMQQGDLQGAIASWNRALSLQPDYADALENRSAARRMIGDLNGAIKDATHVIGIEPQRPAPYWLRGEIYGLQGQFVEAIADYEYLICYHAAQVPIERLTVALDHWRHMIESQPISLTRTTPASTETVSVQTDLAQTDLAQADLAQADRLDQPIWQEVEILPATTPQDTGSPQKGSPQQENSYHSLKSQISTSTLIELPRESNAELDIVDATFRTLRPIDLVHKARTLVNQGNYRTALQELNAALEIDSLLIDAYVERGAIYALLGATLQAKTDLDRALSLRPHDGNALANRANVELMSGTPQNAFPYLQKAFETTPTLPALHLIYGSFCESEGNYPVALAAYDRAITLDPNAASAYYQRGRMYMKYHMPQYALTDFLQALDLQPAFARAYFSVGGIYAARGEAEIAHYYYRKAADLGYEAAQQTLDKRQHAAPPLYQPTPSEYWHTDNVDLLAQALVDLAKFAYAYCGPVSWQEQTLKKGLLGLSAKLITETVQRWQVELQTVNQIDSNGVSRTLQAAVLDLQQIPPVVLQVLPLNSNSYSLSIWANRSAPGMRTSVFIAGLEDYLTLSWSDLPNVLLELLRTQVLELHNQKFHYTGKSLIGL